MASDDKRDNNSRSNQLVGGGGSDIDKVISDAAQSLTNEQKGDLAKYAIKKRIDLEADQANREAKYAHARQQLSDHIDIVDSLKNTKSGPLSRNVVSTSVESGAGKTDIKSKDGAACFVATVTYQDAFHPSVVKLRYWRDTTLIRNKHGRAFIAVYWIIGPFLAKFVDKSSHLRGLSRAVIEFIIKRIDAGNPK